jgi:hypothetical protein
MIQLSYISSVAHPLSTEELLHLLQTCLVNNQRGGVTGMLLYGNDTFLQTLEGDEETVDGLYAKILHDPRHADVKSLRRRTIETREYSDWSMGFKRISDEDLTHVEGLIDFSEKKFTFKHLADHAGDAERLMDHFSTWDPLLRKIEEKDDALKQLRTMLAQARGCVEIATLVLESVAAAGKVGKLEDEHLRLCDVALNALRQVPDMQAQADAGVAGYQ